MYPLVNVDTTNWKDPPCWMGTLLVYQITVSLPEGKMDDCLGYRNPVCGNSHVEIPIQSSKYPHHPVVAMTSLWLQKPSFFEGAGSRKTSGFHRVAPTSQIRLGGNSVVDKETAWRVSACGYHFFTYGLEESGNISHQQMEFTSTSGELTNNCGILHRLEMTMTMLTSY